MEWATLIPLALLGGLLLAGTIIGIMIYFGKKSNIDYVILQTFEGAQRPFIKKGLVDVKNDGGRMAEHVMTVAGKQEGIGTFHQKYLKPSAGGRYIMLLEEHDVGRYRPLEYRGDIFKSMLRVPVYTNKQLKDKKGEPLLDKKGEPIYEIKKDKNGLPIYQEIEEEVAGLVSVPNDDIDYMLSRKEKNRLLLARKKETNKWLPYIAGGLIFLFVFMGVVLSSYYNYQTSIEIRKGLGNFDGAAQTERVINLFVEKMTNTTTRDVFKVQPEESDADKPPGK